MEPEQTAGVAPAAGTGASDDDALLVAQRLLGRRLTEAELVESARYDDLRAALRSARDDAELSQSAIAQCLALTQSEVSRLETSVGPGTRLGRVQRYLAACGAQLVLLIRTARAHEFAIDWAGSQPQALPIPEADVPASHAGQPGMEALLSELKRFSGEFRNPSLGQNYPPGRGVPPPGSGYAQNLLIEHILALDVAMEREKLEPERANRVRGYFLRELQRMAPPAVELAPRPWVSALPPTGGAGVGPAGAGAAAPPPGLAGFGRIPRT
jgi:hypothetical protein